MSKVIMGFSFETEEEYALAKKELEYIGKIDEGVKTNNPEHLLEIYNKIIQDGIFKTPVGMEYLRNIQLRLSKNSQIDNSQIQNIPAIVYKKDVRLPQKQNHIDSNKNDKKRNGNKYKDYYIRMIIVNITLVIIIAIMFIISHNSKKFDEDYYRESIENEYISWEKSLQERESVLNESENN